MYCSSWSTGTDKEDVEIKRGWRNEKRMEKEDDEEKGRWRKTMKKKEDDGKRG